MSKRVLIAGLTVLIALGVAATLAVSASADDDRKARGGKVIRLEACGEHEEANFDLPNAADVSPQVGDHFVGWTELCKRGGDEPIGFARFTCTWNFNGVMCTNHNTLKGRGQIVTMQSADPSAGPVAVEPVVGGTGEFRNSRGQARVDFSAGPPKITIRLIG